MKLGNYAHVSISVHTIRESFPYYTLLGFTTLFGNNDPQPWILMTDGLLNIHLYESQFPSPSLHYFSAKMTDKITELQKQAMNPQEQISKDGTRRQHTLIDPNDVQILLMHHDDDDMPRPSGISTSVLGKFAEVTISTSDLRRSVAFWKSIGYDEQRASSHPYPWMMMFDGVLTVALHQTGTFNASALTYLAPSVPDQVHQLKTLGIPLTHEIKNHSGELVGAILNAPDGQLFFLLQGEP